VAEEPLAHQPDERAWTDERAERYERLRVGAEAMAGLKPQEIRCLLLKAEGLSYQEICAATGFTYTKVNRCLTEGRRRFLKRVAGIEAGAECQRLMPLISKLSDGEASADELRALRPHLKGCLACKATLREYRAAPARSAGLVALAGGGGWSAGFVGRLVEAVQERWAGLGDVAGAKAASRPRRSCWRAAGRPGSTRSTTTRRRSRRRRSQHRRARGRRRRRPHARPAAGPAAAGASSPDASTAAIEAVAELADPQAPAAAPEKSTTAARKPATAEQPAELTPEFDPGTSVGSGAPEPEPQPREFGVAQRAPQRLASASPQAAPANPPSSTALAGRGAVSEFGP
jgi:hypothetical protein